MYIQFIFYGTANVSFCSRNLSDHVFACSFVCYVRAWVRACVCVFVCVRARLSCVSDSECVFECMHHIKVYLGCVLQADSSHMIICQDIIVLRIFLLRGWYVNISSVRCQIFNFSHINLYKSSWYLVYTTDLWKSTDICSCNIQFVVATFYEKKQPGFNLMA